MFSIKEPAVNQMLQLVASALTEERCAASLHLLSNWRQRCTRARGIGGAIAPESLGTDSQSASMKQVKDLIGLREVEQVQER